MHIGNFIGGAVIFVLILAVVGVLIWFFGVRNKKNQNQMQDGPMEGKEYTFQKFGIQNSDYLWRR